MSGPKVVRVVTREELVSQSQVLLARLDKSVALWQEACEGLGQQSLSELDTVIARRNGLESLFRADKFQEFTRGVNDELGFLESDIDRRRALHLEAKAREASRRDAGQQTARSLLSVLKGSIAPADKELFGSLELAASGRLDREAVDKLLAQVMKLLSPVQENSLSQAQRNLAKRLATDMGADSLVQWAAPGAQADQRAASVERGLAELSVFAEPSLVAEFDKRLVAVRAIGDEGSRNLRLDSLTIEINQARLIAVKLSGLVTEIHLVDAELAAINGEVDELRRKLRDALDDKSPEEMASALKVARAGLLSIQNQRAASERRKAVLHGLAKLGYAVNEGMSTALANSGRIVVQRPDFPGYGVELLGSVDSQRLQVRTVALAAARDESMDLDAESRWCADFTKLKRDLGSDGTEVLVERALDVGAVPLRVVESDIRSPAEHSKTQRSPKSGSTRGS